MCFYHGDYDWSASVVEKDSGPTSKDIGCDECCQKIKAGEWRLHIFMQEHEECERCAYSDCDCPETTGCCQCPSPDFPQRYIDKAVEMFPHIVPHLSVLWPSWTDYEPDDDDIPEHSELGAGDA